MHLAQGDKNAADQAAVDMMRKVLSTVQMNGIVVIGEGEKDVRVPNLPHCRAPVDAGTPSGAQGLMPILLYFR